MMIIMPSCYSQTCIFFHTYRPYPTMSVLGVEIVVFGILTRLPAKEACKCKSVCKEWCTMLSTHGFEKDHCSRSSIACNQKTLLTRGLICSVYQMDFQTGDYGPPRNIQFPFPPGLNGMSILAHLDGLLCVTLKPTHELVLWNPTTTAYKLLSTRDGEGLYDDIRDAVGLYNGHSNDYNILHVKRSSGVIAAQIYSRRLGSWRKIPFKTRPEYAKRMVIWSAGTLCRHTLYFTVSESWDAITNVVIGFHTITEQITEIRFPLVPQADIFRGVLANVQNSLHMVLTTLGEDSQQSTGLWSLQGDHWSNIFSTPPIPPIPFSTWVTVTHYMTNGRWFVMSGPRKLYEFPKDGNPLDCFYTGNWFLGEIGTLFTETIVSPTYFN
ncbi:putative F-box associated interaction domain, F-box-like domain superfamily [Helianthus anomalus]